MWMQILLAGGFKVVGQKFFSQWEETFRDANPGGFYESVFRRGLLNDSPQFPSNSAIKIFPPGLARTPIDRIDYVIATVRDVREFVRSRERFWAMEDAAAAASKIPEAARRKRPVRHNLALEWWQHNMLLLLDSRARRYPIKWIAYDSTVHNAGLVVSSTFQWLGAENVNVTAGVRAVEQAHRTQQVLFNAPFTADDAGIPNFPVELCREFYQHVRSRRPFSDDFVHELMQADSTLGDSFGPVSVE